MRITIGHPELPRRRMADLDGIMRRFLDAHELSATQAVLVKHLG